MWKIAISNCFMSVIYRKASECKSEIFPNCLLYIVLQAYIFVCLNLLMKHHTKFMTFPWYMYVEFEDLL